MEDIFGRLYGMTAFSNIIEDPSFLVMYALSLIHISMKQKQLAKGIDQLMDEGVAQLFVNQCNGRKIIGTVGQLQFEVIQYRLENRCV